MCECAVEMVSSGAGRPRLLPLSTLIAARRLGPHLLRAQTVIVFYTMYTMLGIQFGDWEGTMTNLVSPRERKGEDKAER